MDCAGLGSPNFAGVGDGASDRPRQAAFHGDGAARDADPAGTRAPIYPKDLWKLVQKGEKVAESKLKVVKLGYTLCHPAGCTAEVEVTDELLNGVRTSGGFVAKRSGAGAA